MMDFCSKFCPDCQAAGQRSQVTVGMTTVTCVGASQFYDEDGQLHIHDPNARTTYYSCSNGHSWSESKTQQCWCEEE